MSASPLDLKSRVWSKENKPEGEFDAIKLLKLGRKNLSIWCRELEGGCSVIGGLFACVQFVSRWRSSDCWHFT